MPVDEFVAVCADKPAIHRFPASMGRRIYELCTVIATDYDGDGTNVWKGVESGRTLARRLAELPGFGPEKTKIFVALLAKRFGIRPPGWEQAAGVFADDTPRSVADIDGPATLAEVREWKRAQKQAGKTKQQ